MVGVVGAPATVMIDVGMVGLPVVDVGLAVLMITVSGGGVSLIGVALGRNVAVVGIINAALGMNVGAAGFSFGVSTRWPRVPHYRTCRVRHEHLGGASAFDGLRN